jgi:enamine deaminase RidA (YjgF/YER057c/UK114 family)
MRMTSFLLPDGWQRGSGYAHGVVAEGRMVALAGQVGWDPQTQRIASDDFAAQTRQALANVAALLRSAGATPDQLVRMTWYITDRDGYHASLKQIGTAWREFFGRHYPAMSVVIVAGLIEEGALIEIEATAVIP